MTRHRTIVDDPTVRAANPLLAHAASLIGYPAIRARGTMGGSLAHADPVSEFPCVAVALRAEFRIGGPAGCRAVAASDFFQGYFTTAVQPGELLSEVRFPHVGGATGWGFAELARKAGDYAVVAVAATVTVRDGTALRGRPATAESVAAAAEAISAQVTAEATRDLTFASHVAGVLGRRALGDALERAGSSA
jgi:carbon-monoxide dehydrogenase medium subunit